MAARSPTSPMAATRSWPPARRSSSATMSSPRPASAPTWGPRSSSTSSAARPGSTPAAAVIVATVRALKMHGGVAKDDLGKENLEALREGPRQSRPPRRATCASSACRRSSRSTTSPPTPRPSMTLIREHCRERARRRGLRLRALGQGLGRHRGAGRATWSRCARRRTALDGRGFRHLYPDEMPLWDKMRTIAQRDLRRRGHHRRPAGARPVQGLSRRPATATSRSASPRPSTASRPTPNLKGAPSGHVVPIRELRLAGGAEFLVVICGEIMTMPGLPQVPGCRAHPARRGRADRGPVLGDAASPAGGGVKRRRRLRNLLLADFAVISVRHSRIAL